MTSAKEIGALLTSYVCTCEHDCAIYWIRAMVLDKGQRIVKLNFTKTQFHQFLVTLIGNFYDKKADIF
jgi:hypothetical protein